MKTIKDFCVFFDQTYKYVRWAAIFTIIISVYTLVNYMGDNGTENKINDDKPLNSKTELTIPKVIIDKTFIKPTDTTNNISKHNK